MSSLQEVNTEFIQIYEGVASKRGLPTLFGRIMAIFLLEERELSQKDVSDLSGYSVSSVSRTLDQMVRMGLVHKHKDASLRQFVYHMNVDYYDLAISGLETWMRQAEISINEMGSLRRKIEALRLAGEEKIEADCLHETLKDIEEKTGSILGIIKKDVEELRRSRAQSNSPRRL